jgi:hypothetical protein
MNQIPYESGAYYVFDRAYMATKQLHIIHKIDAYFIVRYISVPLKLGRY